MPLDRDVSFTWFGHSAVRVETADGKVVLIDPWLENPKSPVGPGEIGQVDVLLVTHGHFDHMGNGGSNALAIASRLRPVWPCIHEMSLWAGRNLPGGMDAVIGMNKGGTVEAHGIRFTMVHADHSGGDIVDGGTTPTYLGDPVGFVIELPNGFRFFHAGDTNVTADLRLVGELYRPELVLLPIGGHFTMGPRGAALAVEMLGAGHVMPIHYGTFPILTGTPDELRVELDARGLRDVEIHAPEPGGIVR